MFPTGITGCTNGVATENGRVEDTEGGALLLTVNQNCTGQISVKVQYLLTDGAFRKDVFISGAITGASMTLLASPSDCDGYLYVPFQDQAPRTGFETSPQDRIVPVSDTGVSSDFQSSYLVAPDSIGGLTGQGTLGLRTSQ